MRLCHSGIQIRFSASVFVGAIMLFASATPSYALMTSPSYRIWSDTVSSGGNRSTSGGYILQDTIGDTATGETQASASYLLKAGLPAIFAEPVLLMNLSANSVTLSPSTLDTSVVSTGSYTITVSTNASAGYTLTATEDGDFRSGTNTIPDVTDGSVTAGAGEYGIAVSGTEASFVDDRALTGTPLTIASRASFITNSVTTVTHRAAPSSATPPGTYAHTVTYVVIGNF